MRALCSTNTLCLNPCFNGRYSQSNDILRRLFPSTISLNPCFNGRYSQSARLIFTFNANIDVLILVLMEDTLREGSELGAYKTIAS